MFVNLDISFLQQRLELPFELQEKRVIFGNSWTEPPTFFYKIFLTFH
jgi:hypothetical protein